MHTRRLLTENIIALTVLQLLNYAAPLLTVPYLVRVLEPAHFGLLSFAQGVVLFFDFVTDFGFNFSATRAIAACREEPEAVSRIFWATIFAKAILMSLSGITLFLLVTLTPAFRPTPQLFAATFLYVVGTTLFPSWLFQGMERLKLAAALFGVARLLSIPALLIFVRHPRDYVIAGAIQASVELLAGVFAIPFIRGRLQVTWRQPSLSDLADSFRKGWPLFLSGFALYFSMSSTTVILGFVAGAVQVGYFSAADKLIKAATGVLSPFGQALYPHIVAVKLKCSVSALQLIRKSFAGVGVLSLAASIVTFLVAHPLCELILGASFRHSASVLQCLSPLPLLWGLANVFGIQAMLVFEMEAHLARIYSLNALLSIPLIFFLSKLSGATGAAAASVILAAFTVGAMMWALRHRGISVLGNPWQSFRSPLHIPLEPEATSTAGRLEM